MDEQGVGKWSKKQSSFLDKINKNKKLNTFTFYS